MKPLLRITPLLAIFLVVAPAWAQLPVVEGCSVASGESLLSERIDRLLSKAPSLQGARVSIQIATAPDGQILYEKNPKELLTPASVVKLVTAAAALGYLGQEYSYPTELYGRVSKDATSIVGPLYVKGYGDPSLVSERLFLLAESLRSRGIATIEGDLVVDESYFDTERFNPNWKGVGSDQSYVACTGGFSANFNVITLVVRPGKEVGAKANVKTEPLTSYVRIDNRTKTGKPGSGLSLDSSRFSGDAKPKVVVRGRVPIDLPEKRLYKNVEDPGLYAGTLLEEFLERSSVTLHGTVTLGTVSPGTPLLDTAYSKPLGLIVRDLNKFSNNFIAEQLVKTLGARHGESPGSWDSGLNVLNQFLKKIGTPEGGWKLFDGSGLSHGDRLSAQTLVHVLRYVYQDARLRADYEASLSLGGADGTVRRRFRDDAVARRVRAKTGHLDGVSALAGYLYPAGLRPLAFAVLINGFRGGFPDVETDVDRVITEVLGECAQPEVRQALQVGDGPPSPQTGATP